MNHWQPNNNWNAGPPRAVQPYGGDTVFGSIIRGESPANIIYQDAQCLAFHDIRPQAPVHFLVVPKKPIPSLSASEDSDEWLLGHLMIVARRVARQLGLYEGYRIVINNGPHACQTIYHLHVHVVGGKRLRWPPC